MNHIQNITTIIFCFLAFTCTHTVEATVNLTFGVYASDKPSSMVKKLRPVLNELEPLLTKYLNDKVTIEMVVAPTYEAGIRSLLAGEYDFSRLGPASYIQVKNKDKSISILAMETKNGKKVFKGLFCVKKDSQITSIHALSGKKVAFGSKDSTIGRYLAQALLLDNHITSKDLLGFEYVGRHDTVGTAVAYGDFDAGALKEDTFEKLVKNGVPIKSLITFPNVTKPWVGRPELPENIATALKKAFIELAHISNNMVIKKFSFVEGEDSDYNKIRHAIKVNNLFFK